MPQPITIYVDVDETLVRNYGRSRIPMPQTIRHVRALYEQGVELYCWSSGGAAYARESAREVRLEDCFVTFLPKPQVMIDDQPTQDWRRLLYIHPASVEGETAEDYRRRLRDEH